MDNIHSKRRIISRPVAILAIIVSLLLVFFIGISVGASSKANNSTNQPTAAATPTDTTPTQTTQTPQCTLGMGEVSYQGTCQPAVKGMSCNFIQGSSSYTCSVNLYDSQKTFNCTAVGASSYCY
jgi:hypothetical protein